MDITISKNNLPIAGIGVKFVMQNYAQNSNNYFENMLGETANIQCRNIPYFQILIIPDKMPYFESGRKFKKWEILTTDKIKKYLVLSNDPQEMYPHTPAKILLYIISLYDLPDHPTGILAENRHFFQFYEKNPIRISTTITASFGNNIILNDYQTFLDKIAHRIQSI